MKQTLASTLCHAVAIVLVAASVCSCGSQGTDDVSVDASGVVDAAQTDAVATFDSIGAGNTDAAPTPDTVGADACMATAPEPTGLQDAATQTVTYGLDERPANTNCRPLPRPTGLPDDPFPQTLLATGCFQSTDLRKPVAGAIPYDVNAPLWSDGAVKRRFMFVPDNEKIHIMADGDFDFPRGTSLLKTFELGGKMLETRFLVRHDDGQWAGYTYVWDKDGKNEATLLGDVSASRNIGLQTWIFPSRAACLTCHTEAAGRSLGLEVGQLNGDFEYPGNRRANQLATLAHIGLFDAALSPVQELARYATPGLDASGSVEAQSRAYLHANCSHCHRPGGLQTDGNVPNIDLRYGITVAEMKLVNQAPVRGEFGIPGVLLIKPGAPSQSMLAVRMKTTVANVRMPAIGSVVVDDLGLAVVNAWIKSMNACL